MNKFKKFFFLLLSFLILNCSSSDERPRMMEQCITEAHCQDEYCRQLCERHPGRPERASRHEKQDVEVNAAPILMRCGARCDGIKVRHTDVYQTYTCAASGILCLQDISEQCIKNNLILTSRWVDNGECNWYEN